MKRGKRDEKGLRDCSIRQVMMLIGSAERGSVDKIRFVQLPQIVPPSTDP